MNATSLSVGMWHWVLIVLLGLFWDVLLYGFLCQYLRIFLVSVFLRWYVEGIAREGKRATGTRTRAWTNNRSSFSLQLWRLRKDLYWCWGFEEAFTYPWWETICLPLRRMWKGNMFNLFMLFLRIELRLLSKLFFSYETIPALEKYEVDSPFWRSLKL